MMTILKSILIFLIVLAAQFFYVDVFSQVQSSKTRYFIDLVPDRVDSIIADTSFQRYLQNRVIRLNSFHAVSGGIHVGQDIRQNNPFQSISSQITYQHFKNGWNQRIRAEIFKVEQEKKALVEYQNACFSLGYQNAGTDFVDFYGGCLSMGYKGIKESSNYSSGFLYGSGIHWGWFLENPSSGMIMVDLNFMYGLNDYQLKSIVQYGIYLGNSVFISFVAESNYIEKRVHSISAGAMIGFMLPTFIFEVNQ